MSHYFLQVNELLWVLRKLIDNYDVKVFQRSKILSMQKPENVDAGNMQILEMRQC